MLLPSSVRIHVATQPVSLRKSFEGLGNEVRTVIGRDPLSGHVFLFLNRQRSQLKLLVWTRGGLHDRPQAAREGPVHVRQ